MKTLIVLLLSWHISICQIVTPFPNKVGNIVLYPLKMDVYKVGMDTTSHIENVLVTTSFKKDTICISYTEECKCYSPVSSAVWNENRNSRTAREYVEQYLFEKNKERTKKYRSEISFIRQDRFKERYLITFISEAKSSKKHLLKRKKQGYPVILTIFVTNIDYGIPNYVFKSID